MLDYQLYPEQGILRVHPSAPLAARDIAQMSEVVDRYLANHDYLNGMLISGDDCASLISNLHFSGSDQPRIKKVAAVSNNNPLNIAPLINQHLMAAEVKHFAPAQEARAIAWLQSA